MSIWGQQLSFKRKHRVVPIHGHVYRKIIESKVYLLIIHARTEKKGQDCDYVFGSSTKFQGRMNGFVKADICRQVSVCLHVFAGFYLPLNPSATTVYARSAFSPSLRFTLSL